MRQAFPSRYDPAASKPEFGASQYTADETNLRAYVDLTGRDPGNLTRLHHLDMGPRDRESPREVICVGPFRIPIFTSRDANSDRRRFSPLFTHMLRTETASREEAIAALIHNIDRYPEDVPPPRETLIRPTLLIEPPAVAEWVYDSYVRAGFRTPHNAIAFVDAVADHVENIRDEDLVIDVDEDDIVWDDWDFDE
jgi:hypothetical protein